MKQQEEGVMMLSNMKTVTFLFVAQENCAAIKGNFYLRTPSKVCKRNYEVACRGLERKHNDMFTEYQLLLLGVFDR